MEISANNIKLIRNMSVGIILNGIYKLLLMNIEFWPDQKEIIKIQPIERFQLTY